MNCFDVPSQGTEQRILFGPAIGIYRVLSRKERNTHALRSIYPHLIEIFIVFFRFLQGCAECAILSPSAASIFFQSSRRSVFVSLSCLHNFGQVEVAALRQRPLCTYYTTYVDPSRPYIFRISTVTLQTLCVSESAYVLYQVGSGWMQADEFPGTAFCP